MDTFIWIISLIVTLVLLYLIVNGAVRNALADHYKIVRWYEKTGEWLGGGKPPRSFDAGPVRHK